MKSKVIPAILIAVIVVAGIFAFQPVELAKAVHFFIIAELTAVIEANNGQVFKSGVITPADLKTGTEVILDCEEDYVLFGITLDLGPGDYITPDDEIDVTIGTDDIATELVLSSDSALAVLEGKEAANADEDTVVEFFLGSDDGDEDIQEIRFSVATTGDCSVGRFIP